MVDHLNEKLKEIEANVEENEQDAMELEFVEELETVIPEEALVAAALPGRAMNAREYLTVGEDTTSATTPALSPLIAREALDADDADHNFHSGDHGALQEEPEET